MSNISPKILALDFDGVICDGMGEYFQSSKRTYQKIWTEELSISLDDLFASFAQLRPVIETGWEMPVLIRALALGISAEEILENWSNIAHKIIEDDHLDPKIIAHTLDSSRDDWINEDLTSWLALHSFYPGVIDRLKYLLKSPIVLYIVTTKEGRFVKQLLHNYGVEFSQETIFGKEVKRPKYQTLREILTINSEKPNNLWFVEDFLKPLQQVQQQPDLQGVKLYLANWGYNTKKIRDSLKNNPSIKLLSLEEFTQDFNQWNSYITN
jgi:phosphoglycolate phosphatase-like HAD superfamily hydrolase